MRGGEIQVDGRGSEPVMPEDFLDCCQGDVLLQGQSREGVPEHMRGHRLGNFGAVGETLHNFPNYQLADLHITKVTRLKQQRVILQLFHYRLCTAEHRQALSAKACQTAKVSSKPIYVFRALMHYLEEQRLVMPGDSWMQDTIGQALTHEQERLATLVSMYLSQADADKLTQLLEDAPGLAAMTQLKREPKDFRASEIKREIQRGAHIRDLYHLAEKRLPTLDIANESIKYYASLVSYYSVYKLKRFPESTTYIYLLCFVYHRYQRLHDNLMQCFLSHVRQYREAARAEAKEQVYHYRREGNEQLDKAARLLRLFTDRSIAHQTPFHQVRAKAFSILDAPPIDFVADHITTDVTFDETALQWEHIDALAPHLKRHLRPIFLSVDWAASASHRSVIEATDFLKRAFRRGRSLGQAPSETFPQACSPEVLQSQDIKFTRGASFFLVGRHRWFFKGQHVMHFDRPIWIHHHLFDNQLDHSLAVLEA
jgi:hypothetical protein